MIAALLGAEEFGFATAPLIVEGCVMMRKCHLNTCPVGIATQDPALREKFAGRPEHLVNYFFFVAEEVRELMAQLGFRRMDDMIGHAEVLRQRTAPHVKARALDLTPLLHVPKPVSVTSKDDSARRMVRAQDHGLSSDMNHTLRELAEPALQRGERVSAALDIRNVHRAVGAMLSGEIVRRVRARWSCRGHDLAHVHRLGWPELWCVRGAWRDAQALRRSERLRGQGTVGGSHRHPTAEGRQFLRDETVIVGNTTLYGATAGEALFGGVAGERFAVRNSGATAVVEGVGDHGCEYMTGGVVVVLGRTGRNFGAGMSGGVAFVLDASRDFATRCNRALVEIAPVAESADTALLKRLIERHARFTGSARAKNVLSRWDDALKEFVRVIPTEYLRALRSAPEASPQEGRRHG